MKMLALCVPGNVGRLSELAVPLQAAADDAGQGFGAVIGCLLLAAEHHDNPSLRIELDDHVRAFVDGPEIVVLGRPARCAHTTMA